MQMSMGQLRPTSVSSISIDFSSGLNSSGRQRFRWMSIKAAHSPFPLASTEINQLPGGAALLLGLIPIHKRTNLSQANLNTPSMFLTK